MRKLVWFVFAFAFFASCSSVKKVNRSENTLTTDSSTFSKTTTLEHEPDSFIIYVPVFIECDSNGKAKLTAPVHIATGNSRSNTTGTLFTDEKGNTTFALKTTLPGTRKTTETTVKTRKKKEKKKTKTREKEKQPAPGNRLNWWLFFISFALGFGLRHKLK